MIYLISLGNRRRKEAGDIPHEAFAPRKKKGRPPVHISRSWLALLALLGFALIFWWAYVHHTQAEEKIVAGSNTDMYMYHLPVREHGFSRLKTGDLPLWNPYTNSGMPFMATYQAALFYPLNFPHWFLRAEMAISLVYLLHIFLAGVFMYLWVREVGGASLAATFGATAYMLCSFVTYTLAWPHIILTHTWIPLVFLMIHRTFHRPRMTEMALLGVVISCQFLAGFLQGFVYTLYGASAYLIFLTAREIISGQREPRTFGRAFAYALLGLTLIPALLTAFQLIPTFQLSALSTRPTEGLGEEAILVGGSLYPSTFFAAMVNPGSYSWAQYTLYPGILTLVLAVFAFIKRGRWAESGFFLALGAVAALIAFGAHTPIFGLYMNLPTGDWFRLPNRLLIVTAFAVATLAALGCDHLVEDVLRREGASKRDAHFGAFVGLCALFLLLLPKTGGLFVFVLLVGSLLGIRTRSAAIVGMLAVVLVGLDLSLYVSNPVTYPWITPQVFPELKEETQFLRERAGPDRVHVFRAKRDWKNYLLNANFGMVEGIRTTSGYESLALQRYGEFAAYLEHGGAPSYEPPFTGALNWTARSAHPRLLNLLGARYIVEDTGRELYPETSPPNQMPKGFGLKEVFSRTLTIYENPDALPRAFFTTAAEVIRDKRTVLERLADESFDYRSAIVLEERPEMAVGESAAPAGEVVVKTVGEERIDLVVEAPEAGFIFLNETFMPGWRATVDGAEAPIYRADYLFMAVPVTEGSHSIRFRYAPLGFRVGAWLSFISAVCLCMVMAFDIARSRARKMAPWERTGKRTRDPG